MRRGLTLIETLVAGALLLLLIGLALSVLYPSFSQSSRSAARVEMQQQAALALDRLTVDLEQAARASVSVFPEGVAIQQLEGVSGTGLQVWKREVVAYHLRGDVLVREVWPPAPPALTLVLVDAYPSRLTQSDFDALRSVDNGTERRLAQGVKRFVVSPELAINLELERKAAGTFALRRAVTPHNQW